MRSSYNIQSQLWLDSHPSILIGHYHTAKNTFWNLLIVPDHNIWPENWIGLKNQQLKSHIDLAICKNQSLQRIKILKEL